MGKLIDSKDTQTLALHTLLQEKKNIKRIVIRDVLFYHSSKIEFFNSEEA